MAEPTFVRCPLCGDPERTEDIVGGVCLTCADAITFAQHARRASVVPGHRPEWLDDVPTGWCECGKKYPHQGRTGTARRPHLDPYEVPPKVA